MTKPVRIRLSRARGFDLQAHSISINGLPAINVARPGPWGNPFVVGKAGDAGRCVELHKALMGGHICMTATGAPPASQSLAVTYAEAHLPDLVGHNLACWCRPGQPCHADTLLALARICEEVTHA